MDRASFHSLLMMYTHIFTKIKSCFEMKKKANHGNTSLETFAKIVMTTNIRIIPHFRDSKATKLNGSS